MATKTEVLSDFIRTNARVQLFNAVYVKQFDLTSVRQYYLDNADKLCCKSDYKTITEANSPVLNLNNHDNILKLEALRRFELDLRVARRFNSINPDPPIEGPIKNLYDLTVEENGLLTPLLLRVKQLDLM